MDIKELEEQLEILNEEFQENKNKLLKEFCFSNNPYKVGDIFEDHMGKILIEKIMPSGYRFSGAIPCCSYYGLELKKDGTPRKNGSKRQCWQSNDIKKRII